LKLKNKAKKNIRDGLKFIAFFFLVYEENNWGKCTHFVFKREWLQMGLGKRTPNMA
jgi:hypothetical protein